ncbi:hypothetical protein [Agromyces allii]|uniref:Uncharacterized protein n=1 Tax=Agromyces allii TaxID=393607 RepID=A0ABP5BDZ6_9MICO|nr:hypothetical protein [Agromyces allii]
MSTKKSNAVLLKPSGEAPVWGKELGSSTSVDEEIASARDATLDEQKRLFRRLVRALYDQQFRVPAEDRDDPSDIPEWIATLAHWFGWSDELRDREHEKARADAAEVSEHEIKDALRKNEANSAR